MFIYKRKLIKNDIKFMAELLYEDVSSEKWDQENLTKDNLNFSIESVRLLDEYADRLMHTDFGQKLLKEHPDNVPVRIGVYLGEVIKNHINGQYKWFEFKSIQENTIHLDNYMVSVKDESILYSKN